MDQRSTKVGELLHEAAETHHQVFRITDGADEDWASWYAQWLVTLSELPEVLGGTVVIRVPGSGVEPGPQQRKRAAVQAFGRRHPA